MSPRHYPAVPLYLCRAGAVTVPGGAAIVPMWLFDCPCGMTHYHGAQAGHRAAHCRDGSHPRGYYIELEDTSYGLTKKGSDAAWTGPDRRGPQTCLTAEDREGRDV